MGEVREEVGERKTKSEARGETKNGEVRVGGDTGSEKQSEERQLRGEEQEVV